MKQVLNTRGVLSLFGQAILIMLVAWLIGLGLVRLFAEEPQEQMVPMTVAAMICLFGAGAGLLPLLCAVLKNTEMLGKAFLLGVPIRMLATLVIALIACGYVAKAHQGSLLMWLGGFYLVTLAWETKLAIKFVKRYLTIENKDHQRQSSLDNEIK